MKSNVINKGYPYILRSTLQQTAEGLLWQPPSYIARGYDTTGGTGSSVQQPGIFLRRFELHNRSGGSASVGIGFRLANRYWIAGQWVNAAGTPFTDDTADAQSRATADFPLETLTNNDGFVVASSTPFDWVSAEVTTAGVSGGAVVHAVRYTNFAGTGWTAVSANSIYTDQFTSSAVYAAGALEFVWQAPADWGKTAAGGLSGIPEGLYALNIRATTAPLTTAAVARDMEVGVMPQITEALSDNGIFASDDMIESWHERVDALVAYFSVANAGNRVYAEVVSV